MAPPKKTATMASTSKTARKVLKPKGPKGKGKKAVKVEEVAVAQEEVAKVMKATDIFRTIDIKAPPGEIKDGLSIIRSLGNGKYEIVNLGAMCQNNLGSKSTADFIKDNPGRMAAMNISKAAWDTAILKCDIAMRLTEKQVFRFFKLPLELRENIIKLIVKPAGGMRYVRNIMPDRKPSPAIALMMTCQQMYSDIQKHYWSNSFYVEHLDLKYLRKEETDPYFVNNVKSITYRWNDSIRDPTAYRFIKQLPQLKHLEIEFSYFNLECRERRNDTRNVNHVARNDKGIGMFRLMYGLDALLEIRGLESTVLRVIGHIPPVKTEKLEKERKAMEKLMAEELTLPVPTPLPEKGSKNVKGKGKGKQPASSEDDASGHEESGDEEEVYLARPTRSRAPRVAAAASPELLYDHDAADAEDE